LKVYSSFYQIIVKLNQLEKLFRLKQNNH